jgi:hypothetical protein
MRDKQKLHNIRDDISHLLCERNADIHDRINVLTRLVAEALWMFSKADRTKAMQEIVKMVAINLDDIDGSVRPAKVDA